MLPSSSLVHSSESQSWAFFFFALGAAFFALGAAFFALATGAATATAAAASEEEEEEEDAAFLALDGRITRLRAGAFCPDFFFAPFTAPPCSAL